MIVYHSVCAHCSEMTEISLEKNAQNSGFEFIYRVQSLSDSIYGKGYTQKMQSETFCDKTCLVEFIKNNFDENGNFTKKELGDDYAK